MHSEPQLIRVEELWFDDGNLILQAENCLFRIYRGLLSARSSVFRDMFGFPPPAEGNQMMEGCPIVQVYDTATDMTHFLRAVLDSEFFEPPPSKTTLGVVASVLRMSTKYDVRYLRLRAMDHLLSTYPAQLSDWKNRDRTRTIPSIENTPFAALTLAREFDMPWLVPSIVYCISSHDLSKTLDGAEWDGRNLELTWADKKMCVIARNKILLKQNARALAIVRNARPVAIAINGTNPTSVPEDQKCKGVGNACHETRMRCADILTRWGTAGFVDFYEEQQDAFVACFCDVCLETFRVGQEAAVRDLWGELPKLMDLPDWEELERLRGLA
ncbi:hypothetical protein FA15DRAFT_593694 [Coprinopsis marcescibilis]|uniref:BTB domain-containing protein n=1 Tax=Coprinopsis marcescibilis TaxID=230819 RepID=A0A5C3KTB6_COPMA|nr:hypothetical protein FA15DRAFT_593694 [Coprinopsis marcescibilis]